MCHTKLQACKIDVFSLFIVSDFMSKQRGNLPLKNLAKCIFDVDVVVKLPEN